MDERSERIARFMDPFLMVAALLTLPAVAIHESQTGTSLDAIAQALNWATWVPFLIEVVVMLTVVPDRKRWLREHPIELVIVVLTPPVLPPGLQSLRVIRLLRLLRLLRLAQLSRRVFSIEGIRYAALLAAITVIAGGAAFVGFEHSHHYSDWTGLYWAVTTMTTLGSNIYPTTTGAEIISVVMLLVGISFVALLTGAIAQRFLGPEIAEVEAELEEGEKSPEAIALRQMHEVRDQLQGLEVALEQLIEDATTRQADRSSG
ncbi:MAG: potassium channel family protein [Actinomycetota bacterium]